MSPRFALFVVYSLHLLVADAYTYINGICVDCDSAILIPAAGSSTAAPLIRQLAFSFNLVEPSIGVKFVSQSLATAMNRLQTACRKSYELDFAALDYPLEAWKLDNPLISSDLEAVPIVATAAVVTYNIPEIITNVDPDLVLSRQNLYDIIRGNLTQWNDPRILFMNPLLAAHLPNETIRVVMRTDPSGTTGALITMFENLDENFRPQSRTVWNKTLLDLPNRILTQASMGVIASITTNRYSLGVVAQAYVEEAGLPDVRIENRFGEIMTAGDDLGTYAAVIEAEGADATYGMNPADMAGNGTYPLSQLVYLIYHTNTNAECDSRVGMAKFIHWVLTDDAAMTQIFAYPGFISLPNSLIDRVVATLQRLTCDSQPLLQITYVDYGANQLTQTIVITATVLIVIALAILTTLSYKRNNRITRAAGLAFAFFFLVGCIFNYLSVIFWATIPLNTSICISRYAFSTLGYALILGAMFAKCWEISKIFYRAEQGDISPFQELPWWMFCRAFFAVVFFEALFLFIWLAIDPPRSTTRITDDINFLAIHVCTTQYSQVWYSLHFIYFGIVLVWGAYLAYLTRDIWQKYNYPNESRSILMSIYNLAFCAVILVPLVTALDASPAVLLFLIAVAIIFPTTFALIVVHGPKMLAFLATSISKGSKGSKVANSAMPAHGAASPRERDRVETIEPSYTAKMLKVDLHEHHTEHHREQSLVLDDPSERQLELTPFKGTKKIEDTHNTVDAPSLSPNWKVLITTSTSTSPSPHPHPIIASPSFEPGDIGPEVTNPLFGEAV